MATQQITFDRFDGGLMLARPSSVSPANSLANLFNMDVQPGGWLRSRANWRRTSAPTYLPTSSVRGLFSNGGFLWAFGGTLPSIANFNDQGADVGGWLDVGGQRMYIGAYSMHGTVNSDDVLLGTTRWGNGFMVVWARPTAGQINKLLYTVGATTEVLSKTLIADATMPKTGIMVTEGSRIYAVSDDGQSVRFCAVGNALDWTTAGDAGFLPVSQHFSSGQRVYALGVYQGKLAVFTDQSIQLWTIDPNPTAMALDRTIDGVGTRHHNSIVSLNGDLLFLSETGVRSLTTMSNALFPTDVDVGLPVRNITQSPDISMVPAFETPQQTTLALAATPFAQYWVAAPDDWTFGTSMEYGWLAWSYSRQAKLNAWAWHGAGGSPRAKVLGWASVGNRIYMRSDKEPYLLVMTPEVFAQDQTETGAYAQCAMQTQWLDFGKPGKRKSLVGIDIDAKNVTSIGVRVSAGGNRDGITADSILVGSAQDGWTYSGEMLPVNADGTEFRVTFSGGGIGEVQINRFTLHWVPLDD